jgi:hypothetical protein
MTAHIAIPAPPRERVRRPTSAAATARAWLEAVTDRDLDRLAALLADDVWFRVLLPRELIEAHDARTVVDSFRSWFVTPASISVSDAAHHTLAGREHVRYAFRLRPAWAVDTWHLIEQAGYLRVADGAVRRIDLVCTGFHPVA